MKCRHVVVVQILLAIFAVANAERNQNMGAEREYCPSREFKAQCPDESVVVMRSAIYGRLPLGECITEDFGYQCENDVLSEMDAVCSGRQTCSIRVEESNFKRAKHCHNDLKSSLLASYECRKVSVPERKCINARPVVLSAAEGYLASAVTERTRCGSNESPWMIRLRPGQRINITMWDFGYAERRRVPAPRHGVTCRVYVTIRDSHTRRSSAICGGQRRLSVAYVSANNTVEIRIQGSEGNDAWNYFLLHYKSIGCANPEIPEGAWMRRHANTTLFGCHESPHEIAWRLWCNGSHWQGRMGNCVKVVSSLGNLSNSFANIPYVVAVVIIAGIAFVVGSCILVVGVICIKRKLIREHPVPSVDETCCRPMYLEDYSADESGAPGKRHLTAEQWALRSPRTARAERSQEVNEYASMRRPPPPGYAADADYHSAATVLLKDISPEHVYESPELGRRAPNAIPDYFDVDPNCCTAQAHSPCAAHTSASTRQVCANRSEIVPVKTLKGTLRERPSNHVSV